MSEDARSYNEQCEVMLLQYRLDSLVLYMVSANETRQSYLVAVREGMRQVFDFIKSHGAYPDDNRDNRRSAWIKHKTLSMVRHDRALNSR